MKFASLEISEINLIYNFTVTCDSDLNAYFKLNLLRAISNHEPCKDILINYQKPCN